MKFTKPESRNLFQRFVPAQGIVPLLILAAFVVMPTESASADWQFTEWGMTRDEVIEASSGKAVATNEELRKAEKHRDGLQPLLQQSWQSGRFEFTALFYFSSSGELSFVKLRLKKGSPGDEALRDALSLKYGSPMRELERSDRLVVFWQSDADQIVYRRGPRGEAVNYESRGNDDTAGL